MHSDFSASHAIVWWGSHPDASFRASPFLRGAGMPRANLVLPFRRVSSNHESFVHAQSGPLTRPNSERRTLWQNENLWRSFEYADTSYTFLYCLFRVSAQNSHRVIVNTIKASKESCKVQTLRIIPKFSLEEQLIEHSKCCENLSLKYGQSMKSVLRRSLLMFLQHWKKKHVWSYCQAQLAP